MAKRFHDSILIGASMLLMLGASGAQAQTTVALDLPAQPLADSLRLLGKRTDTNILIDPDLVRSLRAPAIKANLTTDEALMRLLSGTGISYRFIDEHTVVLKMAEPHASADPAASTLDEVVVTGSSIRGVQSTTSPVIVLERSSIERSGYQTMPDFIRSLPQAFGGGSQGGSQDGGLGAGANAGNNNEHATAVNLRGLGENATLTLMNGHRMAPSAFGNVVDLSVIPLSAVERIDVLTDGASAVYGADAVAGVVNVILRKDYEGAETRASFGSVTSGGLDDQIYSQALGHGWGTGAIMGSFEYERMGTLSTQARDFTAAADQPSNIINPLTRKTLLLNGHQEIGEHLDIQGDALASWKDTHNVITYNPGQGTDILVNPHAVNLHLGASYALPGEWLADLGGTYARQKTDVGFSLYFGKITPFANATFFTSTNHSIDLQVSGPLVALPGGELKVAAGVTHRSEESSNEHTDPMYGRNTHAERRVTAEFAELSVPLVGEGNALPWMQGLLLSAAVRRDDYSDFGSTTNPKVGIRWSLTPELDFRINWSKAFRPPTAGELLFVSAVGDGLYTLAFAAPGGSGTVPVFYRSGGNPDLGPESSRNLNLGFDYAPPALPGLRLGVSAYQVHFRNRIIEAPYDPAALQHPEVYGSLLTPVADDAAASAYLASFLAAGGKFTDYLGKGIAGIRYVYNALLTNAATVKQNGMDLTGDYSFSAGENRFRAGVNVAYINKIDTQYAAGAATRNSVNTYSQPLRFRSRADVTWTRGAAELTGTVSNSPSYTDTTVVPNDSIASMTTFDLSLALHLDQLSDSALLSGTTTRFNALNVFDRAPPYTNGGGGAINGVHYDVGNASPLGRFLSVEVRKSW